MAPRAQGLLTFILAVGGGNMVLVASVARENAGTCGECTSNNSTFVRPFHRPTLSRDHGFPFALQRAHRGHYNLADRGAGSRYRQHRGSTSARGLRSGTDASLRVRWGSMSD